MLCFDRERESQELWRHFNESRNVLMLAPRRIGKTVLLNQLIADSEERGYKAILINLEGYREEKDFFRALCAEFQEEAGFGKSLLSAFVTRLQRVIRSETADWRQLLLEADLRDFAENLLSAMASAGDGEKWLILVDELPHLVAELIRDGGKTEAHSFLYTLRNLRQTYGQVRWLYTGSVGLDAVARRQGLEGALVDMEMFPLGPFEWTVAAGFVAKLAERRGRAFAAEAVETLLHGLGWLAPYYVEKTAELAIVRAGDEPTVTLAHVERALSDMLDLAHRTYWATWREHLDKNFPDPERTDLFTILRVLAPVPEGASSDTLLGVLNASSRQVERSALNTLLDTLCADGFLDCNEDRSRFWFLMGLLRRWWLRHQVQ